MLLIRYKTASQPPCYGWVHGNEVGPLDGSPYQGFLRLDTDQNLDAVDLLAPVQPRKILCIGRNYSAHAEEHDAEIPEIPILFQKPTSSIIGPEETIYLPPQSKQVEHEAELVVVIGKHGRWIAPEEVNNHILGYTIGNDVTARDLQQIDNQWTRSKGFDTFCSIGPWIKTDFDPSDAIITCHVNDEMRQMASSQDMIFDIRQLVVYISSIMTLEPGDIIFTGTPSGVGPITHGDSVKINIEGLGTLTNPVSKEPSR